jgi:hypothetical protein
MLPALMESEFILISLNGCEEPVGEDGAAHDENGGDGKKEVCEHVSRGIDRMVY